MVEPHREKIARENEGVSIKSFKAKLLRRVLACAGLWCCLIFGLGFWSYSSKTSQNESDAIEKARQIYQLQLANLQWASELEGIYTRGQFCPTPAGDMFASGKIVDIESPGAHQKKSSTALTSPSQNSKLSFYAPPQVADQLSKIHSQFTGVKTKLIPNFHHKNAKSEAQIRDWDRKACQRIHAGADEVVNFTREKGKPVLKFAKPVPISKSCLKCHSTQDKMFAESGGNLHITMPLDHLTKQNSEHLFSTATAHITVVLIGLAILFAGYKQYIATMHTRANTAAISNGARGAGANFGGAIISSLDKQIDPTVMLDSNGIISHVNPAAEQILQTETSLLGKKITDAIKLVDIKTHDPVLGALLDDFTKTARDTLPVLCVLNLPTGERKIVSAAISHSQISFGRAMSTRLTMRKISNLSDIENQFAQVHKLGTIGLMTDSIAHDFRNMLTAISGSAKLLLQTLPSSSDQAHHCENILSASAKASDITRKLLSFSRQSQGDQKPVDLHNLLSELSELLGHILPKNIKLKISPQADSCITIGDHSMLLSSLMNLCINASDAMQAGGEIKISTENIFAPEPDMPGEFIKICVSDTGCGIAPENLDKIFEPFFTTKASEKGTGLGLANTAKYVKNQGGQISVSSQPDKGTCFTILLPASNPANEDCLQK